IIEIYPVIRDAVAAQEVTNGVSGRRCPVPYQDDLGSDGPSVIIEHRHAVRGLSHNLKDASARLRRSGTAPTSGASPWSAAWYWSPGEDSPAPYALVNRGFAARLDSIQVEIMCLPQIVGETPGG